MTAAIDRLSGAVGATNTAGEVMGSPLNPLVWIANHLGGRGPGLRAGDTVRATSTRLGSVSVRVVAQRRES